MISVFIKFIARLGWSGSGAQRVFAIVSTSDFLIQHCHKFNTVLKSAIKNIAVWLELH